MSKREIDYLFEDPIINDQRIALVSIVGPHAEQKCDVWGLKIRGVADNLETAKRMVKKLMKVDQDFHIYTVEVGKFFPLDVKPEDVKTVEYQNEQLNELIKGYYENRELANEQWNKRKNEMVKQAIEDGKNQNSVEHPVSVLNRIRTNENRIRELKEQLASTEETLEQSKTKYSTYTDEEKEQAKRELEKSVNDTVVEDDTDNGLTVEQIREQIINELSNDGEGNNVESIVEKLEETENQLDKSSGSTDHLETRKEILKQELQNTDKQNVNQYINSKFGESEHDSLFQ